MKFILTFKSTDLGEAKFSCNTEESYPLTRSAFCLDITVNRADTHGLYEYSINFVPREEIRLDSVTVTLPFGENKLGCEYPLYMYDNSLCTNSFATIKEIRADSCDTTRSREIVTLHSANGDLNAAFTSFDRFYTEFQTDNKAVTAYYALENKAVRVGEKYTLESIIIDDTQGGLEFFEGYTEILNEKYNIGKMKPVPAGWSSWSCLYGNVTEEDVLKQAELISEIGKDLGADLIQIDDGWQVGGSFGGHWTVDGKRFSLGIPNLCQKINDLGLKMGLWLAPGLIVDESEMFDELYDCLLSENGKPIKSFGGDDALSATKNGSVYSLDIGKKEALDYIGRIFTRAKNEYGAVYFKIDFVMNLLLRMIQGCSRVEYPDGYAVELYRRYVREIREAVGEDIFLLACGSPIGESIGIFDSIRISADITWDGADNPSHPGYWAILKNDAQCAFLRSPFHNKVFINDPDALLLRDYLTDKANDGLNLSYEEAKMWATVVATSGGHILLNEEIQKLSDERRELFTSILPPLGLAARPRDFYEFPWCSETYIETDGAQLVALYNWGEDKLTKKFKNPFECPAVMIDCWSREIFGVLDEDADFDLEPHTSRAFVVKPIREGFVYSDGNFYLGLGGRLGREYYYYRDSAPAGYTKVSCPAMDGIYLKD